MNGFQYFSTFGNVRSGLSGLPAWARLIVGVFALPGILLMLLSVLVFVVSIIALLLLTAPVYRLLRLVCFSRPIAQQSERTEVTVVDMPPSPGRRQVDAKVIE